MFESDAKNGLNSLEPFRHKLMMERAKNPELKKLFIPMLEGELVDSERTTVFLQMLEKLYTEEARIKHLETKAVIKKADYLN